ncbi:MAG: EscU/YscU/HrcU family type III secretion system export apparatus switch protein [Pseudomonadota bacterium]|nr:EscU/YscU/HrcU family type III secretion system export apparatus switch protein [Pseudomonadota bacterium]
MSGLPDSAPNSLATALKRERDQTEVLAQGQGAAAERIVETAAAHNIPVLQDFALSQALQKLPVGTQIPEPLFKALAALLDYLFREESLLAQQREKTE